LTKAADLHKSSAWPLALAYAGLIVYASLFPFADWRNLGAAPWEFWWAPLPSYWTRFDVWINVWGYAPLGLFLAVGACRTGQARWAAGLAVGLCAVLSLTLETLQVYLPARVPSNLDVLLNFLGGVLGAGVALLLHQLGALERWSHWRARWFVPEARGGLVLLALWPAALLYPLALPFGLGRVVEQVEAGLVELLEDTPFLALLPIRETELQPMLSSTLVACVMLSALAPSLLGFCITRKRLQRFAVMGAVLAAGVAASCLSSAWSLGWPYLWAWLDLPVGVGVVLSLLLAGALLTAPARVCAGVLCVAMVVSLSLINQAASSVYFEQTLQHWDLGRGARFYGVLEWLGWCWPYAVLVYAVTYTMLPNRTVRTESHL